MEQFLKVGSKFYIGSQELFQKDLSKLDFCITWDGLPRDDDGNFIDFKTHYKAYALADQLPDNVDFQIRTQFLNQSIWIDKAEDIPLFESEKINLEKKKIEFGTFEKQIIEEPVEQYTVQSKNGFIRFILNPIDFLHSEFGPAITRQTLAIGAEINNTGFTVAGAVKENGGGIVSTSSFISFGTMASDLETSTDNVNDDATETQSKTQDALDSSQLTINKATEAVALPDGTTTGETLTQANDTNTKAIAANDAALALKRFISTNI